MKYIVFLFFLTFFFFGYSQKAVFYYSFKYKVDSNNVNYTKEENFVLNVKDKSSLFTSLKNYKSDSMVAIIKQDYLKFGGGVSFKGVPKTDFTYYVIKKRDSINHSLFYDKIGRSNFYYDEPWTNNWKIENEVKSINGFSCQKATITKYGRNFIAWYAKEITIPDGPYKFNGLPGLILELYDDKKYFHFNLIKYDPKEIREFKIPEDRLSKLVLSEKDKFVNAFKAYKESLPNRIRASGIASEDRIKQIQDKLNAENLTLEFKN